MGLAIGTTHARTEKFREGEPPTADQLGVSSEGLPPARSALVVFAAWVNATKTELAKLEAARDKFMADLGAPAATEKELAALERAGKTGFFTWLKNGADSH